jgi:AcrR family transcriptional regulator
MSVLGTVAVYGRFVQLGIAFLGEYAGIVAERASQAVRVPPGRHALPREFVAQHQRARIIEALAEEIEDKGYRAVTVADIVRRAGVARNTFYDHFSSKEDCFLAASEYAVAESLRRVQEAAADVRGWPAQVNAGLAAFLGYVAEQPALARTCIVEALAAGAAAAERHEVSIQAFVPFFRMGRELSPDGDELPETLEETIVGGIFWIVHQRIVTGQVSGIEELLPELVEFALTPYMGAVAAKQVAGEPSPAS